MIHLNLTRLLGDRRHGAAVLGILGALGVLVGATFVAQALILARVFGLVVGGDLTDPVGQLAPWAVGLLAVLVARPALVAGRELLAAALMTRVKLTLRADLAETLVRTAAADVRGRSGGDHALVVDGVENLDAYLSKYLPQQLTVAVTCTIVGAILLVVDPWVGLLTVAAAVALPLLPRLWDRALARRGADHWEAYGQMHGDFLDSMNGMTTLVLAGADARRQRLLEQSSGALLARTLRQLQLSLVESGLTAFALSAIPVVALAGSLGRGLAPTTVFTLVMLSVELVRPLRELSTHWHAGYAGTFSGRQILEVLDRAAPQGRWRPGAGRLAAADGVEGTAAAGPDPSGPATVRSLSVRDLDLTYPGAEAPSLADVALRLGPGVSAIVGASGSGKSTLAAVLAGLLSPDRGQVLLDSRPARPVDLLRSVALVPQDPVLFTGTVADNIALAGAGRPPGGPSIDEAAEVAGIGTDDPGLGLATVVGERGGLISGGQRQRVAIARALYQGRSVLILDEATSALDLASEGALTARIGARLPEAVVVLVTHRLGSLPPTCPVIVLEGGRVVESGTASRLHRTGDRFGRMARAAQVQA